jgi:hypothetical protein
MLMNLYIFLTGPIYEKYLTAEPDDMGDSPTEPANDDADAESEVTEDGKKTNVLSTKCFHNSIFLQNILNKINNLCI